MMTDDPANMDLISSPEGNEDRQRRRLKGFGLHLLGYFLTMVVAVPVNVYLAPERLWFLFPMIGWGAPLALHAAWAMGLFDGLIGRESKSDQTGNGP